MSADAHYAEWLAELVRLARLAGIHDPVTHLRLDDPDWRTALFDMGYTPLGALREELGCGAAEDLPSVRAAEPDR